MRMSAPAWCPAALHSSGWWPQNVTKPTGGSVPPRVSAKRVAISPGASRGGPAAIAAADAAASASSAAPAAV